MKKQALRRFLIGSLVAAFTLVAAYGQQAHRRGVTSVALADTFTTIDFPGATATQAWGINPRGDIVGFYVRDGVHHGFLLSGDSFTTIDFPDASSTSAYGINRRGDIVGEYTLAGTRHGFLLNG